MRSKVKYMAIVAIVVVAVLAVTLVSCGGGDVAKQTSDWLASASKATVTDTVTLSDVKLDISEGILHDANTTFISIGSLDLVATRVIEGDKLGLTLEVKNINNFKFGTGITSIITPLDSILKDAGIDINNIGAIDSVQIKLNYDPTADIVLTGEFHGYGLKAFITTMPEGDSNPENEKFINLKKSDVTGEDHKRETELIGAIMDLLDNPIYGPSTFDKKGGSTSNVANIVALANKALELYGDDKIYDSTGTTPTQYSAKSLVNTIFAGVGSADNIAGIFAKVLSIAQLKMVNSETQKVDKKEVYSKTELTANVDVNISNRVVSNIAQNVGSILGALGVNLDGLITSLVPQVLQGEITLEAGVKVVTSYANA